MEEDEKKAPEEEAEEEAISEDEESEDEEQPESEESDEDNSEEEDDREMYKATCSECGKECEVPFKPEEGRDVYCEECFRKRRKPRRSFGGRGGFGNRGGGFRRERQMHDATCAECGKECQVPFKPSGDKPVLCKECYMKKKESGQ